jgi:cytochrome d ubiquinol oxidase subunit II
MQLDEAVWLGAAMLGSLVLYALFAGADFGAGILHLWARGPRKARQRELIAESIGPIWEANHVWLILVVVVLFTGFPTAFAELSIQFHAPLLVLLVAIVLRGAAFAFPSASSDRHVEARAWGGVFATASVVAALSLGMIVGALASGVSAPSSGPLNWRGPWLEPFALATGIFTLVLFAYLAAVYLTVDAEGKPELQEDFRRRAMVTGVLAGALALTTFLLAESGAPLVRRGLAARVWSWPLHVATGVAALVALGALASRRFRWARAAAVSQVALIVLGWGASQYPFLIVPSITLQSAAAPPATLRLLLLTLVAGAALLLPSLWLMFRVFKSTTRPHESKDS